MSKDLGLALDAANSVKATLPLGSNAHQLYALMCQHGCVYVLHMRCIVFDNDHDNGNDIDNGNDD